MLFQDHIKNLNPTTEQILDQMWRVQNLYPIRNKQGQLVPFSLNIHQTKIIKRVMHNISKGDYSPIVILKARQVGISTLFAIWFLDDALWYEGKRCVIQSQKIETMHDIFAICRTAYQFMYDFNITDKMPANQNKLNIFKSFADDKQGKISVKELGSFIESKLEVRSMSVNRMHFSEYSFMDLKRIMATVGSLTPECIKIYESTPNGLNHFYDFYQEQKSKNPDNCFFIPWHKHHEYALPVPTKGLGELSQDEQRLKKLYNLSPEQIQFKRAKEQEMRFLDEIHQTFNQEYPENDEECFLLSGSALIDPLILRKLKMQCDNKKPLKWWWDGTLLCKLYKHRTLKQLRKEEKRKYYDIFVGVDPAEGVGGDYSVAIAIGINHKKELEVLMTMRGNKVSPVNFVPKILNNIDKYLTFKETETIEKENPKTGKIIKKEIETGVVYKPLVVVERNGIGHAVLTLLEPHYNNLYVSLKDSLFGFMTTQPSKHNILRDLFNIISEEKVTLNDRIIASELRTLIKKDTGKVEAEEGKHDDCVIALALAYHGYYSQWESYLHKEQKEEDEDEEDED